MAKKTKKEIKKLKKTVGKLQDQNEELSKKLAEALEEQTEEIRNIKAALETNQDGASPAEEEPETEKPEATEAAERKAEELGVDLYEIEGTGSGGRILVSDVEEAADPED